MHSVKPNQTKELTAQSFIHSSSVASFLFPFPLVTYLWYRFFLTYILFLSPPSTGPIILSLSLLIPLHSLFSSFPPLTLTYLLPFLPYFLTLFFTSFSLSLYLSVLIPCPFSIYAPSLADLRSLLRAELPGLAH